MKRITVLILAMTLAACATNRVASERNYSGFLDDYSKLEVVEFENGSSGLVWFADNLPKGKYTRAIIDPTIVYPEPRRDSEEARVFIRDILDYVDATLQSSIGRELIITDNPGPDTVRFQFAITTVEISTEGLSGLDYVPVATLWAGVTTVAGTRDQQVEMFVEGRVLDSQTGKLLGQTVKRGYGRSLENRSTTLTKDDLYPLLDSWVGDAGNVGRSLK